MAYLLYIARIPLRLPDGEYEVTLKNKTVPVEIVNGKVPFGTEVSVKWSMRFNVHPYLYMTSIDSIDSNASSPGFGAILLSSVARVRFKLDADIKLGPNFLAAEKFKDLVASHLDDVVLAINKLIDATRKVTGSHALRNIHRRNLEVTLCGDDDQRVAMDDIIADLLAEPDSATVLRLLPNPEIFEEWDRHVDANLFAIRALCRSEEDPLILSDALLLEAKGNWTEGRYAQALIVAWTAIDVAISDLLRRLLADRNIGQQLANDLLLNRLDKRLGLILKGLTGKSPISDNLLWQKFKRMNRRRNEIVHKGERASMEESLEAIETSDEIIRILTLVEGTISVN